MQGRLLSAVFAAAAAMGSLTFAQHSATAPAVEAKTAEQAYKNITQLKGTPADQLLTVPQEPPALTFQLETFAVVAMVRVMKPPLVPKP